MGISTYLIYMICLLSSCVPAENSLMNGTHNAQIWSLFPSTVAVEFPSCLHKITVIRGRWRQWVCRSCLDVPVTVIQFHDMLVNSLHKKWNSWRIFGQLQTAGHHSKLEPTQWAHVQHQFALAVIAPGAKFEPTGWWLCFLHSINSTYSDTKHKVSILAIVTLFIVIYHQFIQHWILWFSVDYSM